MVLLDAAGPAIRRDDSAEHGVRPDPTCQSPIGVVPRAAVYEILDAAVGRPLVLVCAPAGYGKSVTVASWLRARAYSRTVWADMGGVGVDTAGLWSRIISAVGQVAHTAASRTELDEMVAFDRISPAEIPTRLADWFAEHAPQSIVVLDDLHEVAGLPAVAQLLELCRSLPDGTTVVALTRHDPPWPLHRMRLSETLIEIRVAELRFDRADAAVLLDARSLGIGSEQVDALVAKTEGWAAGLRLASLGLRSANDPHRYIAELSGREGYIADYLMREVFSTLPSAWQDFLSRICVVDQLCPELATALGGGDSSSLFTDLARLNVFVTEVVNHPGQYRIHPLLLDLLRSRINNAKDLRRAHRAAARWYRDQDLPMKALEHSLAAGEWQASAELVGTHVLAWTMNRPPDWLIETLRSVPRQHLLTHPGLAIGLAIAVAMTGRVDGINELIDAARQRTCLIEGRRRRRYEFLLDLIEFGLRRLLGDLDAVLDGFRRVCLDVDVLSGLGLTDWDLIRRVLVGNIGTSELWIGERDCARQHLMEAAARDDHARTSLPVLSARANLAYLEWQDGHLSEAERLATRTIAELEEMHCSDAVQASAAYLALVGVAIDRDELGDADRWLRHAEGAVREPHTTVVLVVHRAQLMMARRAVAEAAEAAERAVDLAQVHAVPQHIVETASRVRTEVLDGRSSLEQSEAVRGRAVRGRIGRLLDQAADERRLRTERGESLDLALAEAVDLGFRKPFLDRGDALRELLAERVADRAEHGPFALDLLDRIPVLSGTMRGGDGCVVMPLSAREMDVLHHLLSPGTVAEIARDLYISVNTVKTHQRSIYQKLGVRGRREAISRARELRLV
ncbi:LuxR C-terminal-related transcriptional regulator [Gordonia sp. (in: high G+C Gram-positive bacteria)]|uniref:LuxR C-terminal-related transcriptional regulator n=1 Tax=Gordonia sp. (in: high G+C Gram-positive bacteria) TaxID=84139 RepID=UPI00168EB6BC|nr:LuxR C-terminal-related transcriptional regulator [Gordonia sp. (in: high G+C Gram-positive bacteria)]NLG46267.1 hypothetical protein [Gordonia sp. (in: high G+C Gram-positive bacteria)]